MTKALLFPMRGMERFLSMASIPVKNVHHIYVCVCIFLNYLLKSAKKVSFLSATSDYGTLPRAAL